MLSSLARIISPKIGLARLCYDNLANKPIFILIATCPGGGEWWKSRLKLTQPSEAGAWAELGNTGNSAKLELGLGLSLAKFTFDKNVFVLCIPSFYVPINFK